MTELHVLSLGAGVQSTRIYLGAIAGELHLDAAIFADTQEEPQEVYRHLEWLKSLNGPPILTGTAGKLGNDLINGRNSSGGRFAAIPAFTTADAGATVGIARRQCSKEYKTEVIGKVLRREIIGLQPGRTAPKGVKVQQYIGISLDEAGRAKRMQENVPAPRYIVRRFWLIERLETRANCLTWLATKGNVPHEVPRSACTFCPYHSDHEWNRLKTEAPEDWERAVEIDHALRGDNAYSRSARHQNYTHRSCKPLDLVQLDPRPPKPRDIQLPMNFAGECEGMCGL